MGGELNKSGDIDDDLFGVGPLKKEIDKPKTKKQDSHDPLAFMKKAQ
jgi:hypothetical protein